MDYRNKCGNDNGGVNDVRIQAFYAEQKLRNIPLSFPGLTRQQWRPNGIQEALPILF